MRVATIDPEEIFGRLGVCEKRSTHAQSHVFSLREDETPAAPFIPWVETGADYYVALWRDLIADLLESLVRRHVQEYMERFLETAEESSRFRYFPETITTSSVDRARKIRRTKFSVQEKFVAYAPEELKNLF